MDREKVVIIGFQDEAALARDLARRLGFPLITVRTEQYRSGELRLVVPRGDVRRAVVVANVAADPSSLWRLLVLARGLRERGVRRVDLVAPWLAFGRQDRLTRHDEAPAGLVLGNLLVQSFNRLITLDAHSQRFIRSFRGRLVNVLPVLNRRRLGLTGGGARLVVAPDHGAVERARRLAATLGCPWIALQKKRGPRGVAARFASAAAPRRVNGAEVLLIDDMADSGQTLLVAARLLKAAGARKIRAFVTHAFDRASLRKRLAPSVVRLDAAFDHARGRLDEAERQALVAAVKKNLSR